jgi:hypothetical protein
MLTPDDVIGVVGLPPLLGAVWILSGVFAGTVSALALVLCGVLFAKEAGNRVTIVCLGVAGFVLAVMVRLYATSLARALSADSQQRLLIPLVIARPRAAMA